MPTTVPLQIVGSTFNKELSIYRILIIDRGPLEYTPESGYSDSLNTQISFWSYNQYYQ